MKKTLLILGFLCCIIMPSKAQVVGIDVGDIVVGEDAVIGVSVPDIVSGVVNVTVNGRSYNVAIVDGKGVLIFIIFKNSCCDYCWCFYICS